jgi:hypothetical protein
VQPDEEAVRELAARMARLNVPLHTSTFTDLHPLDFQDAALPPSRCEIPRRHSHPLLTVVCTVKRMLPYVFSCALSGLYKGNYSQVVRSVQILHST